jgi:hypothetical protein
MTRRGFVLRAGAGGAALLLPAGAAGGIARALKQGPDSVVLRWNAAILEGVRNSTLGPPQVARALAIVHAGIYDAWAAYDRRALGSTLGAALRRPASERSLANKNRAVSHAAFRTAVDLFPGSRATVLEPLLLELGYDPLDTSIDPRTPTGIGNRAAAALLELRHADGSNQLAGYADTSGYAPVNQPMNLLAPFDPATVVDASRWQPLRFVNVAGVAVTPGFVAPHWNRVTPFGLPSGDALRSPVGPARAGSPAYLAQAQELVDLSANLTDEHKAIAEYWADGPRSELPPGHWNLFAQFVSRRDHNGRTEHGLDRDVQLFFALTSAIADAGICAWDNKRAFDSARPITAVRHLFAGRPIRAWAGPGLGTREIDGATWFPYQPTWFPTPPFGEYASGHSTFSAAGAEVLRRFTGRDDFGASVTIAAGSSKVEPGLAPARDVVLSWDTFSAAADQAGISRRYGGIHFEQGDLDARRAGIEVARACLARADGLLAGDA